MYRGGKNCVNIFMAVTRCQKVKSFVKYLLAGVTYVCFIYLVSWLVTAGEWPEENRWKHLEGSSQEVPTMKTIVAYSQRKQAELERPNPIPCGKLPKFPEIKVFEREWRSGVKWDGWSTWQSIPNNKVTLFNAYYDDRQPLQPFVRVLASYWGTYHKGEPLYCQTRRLGSSKTTNAGVEVVAAMPLTLWSNFWDINPVTQRKALLLSCPLTGPIEEPTVVSVVTEACQDPANAFLLAPASKIAIRNITICVKDMDFETDISARLIEWIEINKILGVDKIDIYVQKVHSETEKVLKHYHSKGYIRLFHVPISHHNSNSTLLQRRKDHMVTYNDCLYRNLAESKFIIPLDVDEVILPKVAKDLMELITRLRIAGWEESSSAAIIRTAFYFGVKQEHRYKCASDSSFNLVSESSESLIAKSAYRARCGKERADPVLLRHVARAKIISPYSEYGKSITVSKNVLAAFNHYPLNGLLNTNRHWVAPVEEVQVNHYKNSCNSELVPECKDYLESSVQDCSSHRFGKALWRAIAKAPC